MKFIVLRNPFHCPFQKCTKPIDFVLILLRHHGIIQSKGGLYFQDIPDHLIIILLIACTIKDIDGFDSNIFKIKLKLMMWVTSDDTQHTSFRRTYMTLIRYTLGKIPSVVHSETFHNQSWIEIRRWINASIRLYKRNGTDQLSWLYFALNNLKQDAVYQIQPTRRLQLRLQMNQSPSLLVIIRYICILYCAGLLYLQKYSWKIIMISCILLSFFLWYV